MKKEKVVGNQRKEKFISLGFHPFSKGQGEEGESGFPYLLVATGLAGVILLFLIGRRFRKRKKWDSTEEESNPPSGSNQKTPGRNESRRRTAAITGRTGPATGRPVQPSSPAKTETPGNGVVPGMVCPDRFPAVP